MCGLGVHNAQMDYAVFKQITKNYVEMIVYYI